MGFGSFGTGTQRERDEKEWAEKKKESRKSRLKKGTRRTGKDKETTKGNVLGEQLLGADKMAKTIETTARIRKGRKTGDNR